MSNRCFTWLARGSGLQMFHPSQDILCHVLLNPLVQEALHILGAISHILAEVYLIKLQAVAQKIVYLPYRAAVVSLAVRRCP